jgi:hypothetical protein
MAAWLAGQGRQADPAAAAAAGLGSFRGSLI